MTIDAEQELTRYLHSEAARVTVQEDMEAVTSLTHVVRLDERERRRPVWPAVAAAAACLALLGGLAVLARDRSTTEVPAAGIPSGSSGPAAETPATLNADPMMPLPNGGAFMGQVPSCTSTNGVAFACTIDEFPPDQRTADLTGFVSYYVDDSSHVAGGCRVVSADGRQLACYVGDAAVDQQIISADFLGEWAPAVSKG